MLIGARSPISTIVLHNYIASHGHRIAVVDINQLLIEIVTARRYALEVSNWTGSMRGNDGKAPVPLRRFSSRTIGQCLIANRFLAAINTRFEGRHPRSRRPGDRPKIASSVTKPSVFFVDQHRHSRPLRLWSSPSSRRVNPPGEFDITIRKQVMKERPYISRWLAAILFPNPCEIHDVVFSDRGLW